MKEHAWIHSRGQRLSAMFHTPEKFEAGMPVVVLCHGFTGDKIGFSQVTLNLAKALERNGYAAVRFDYIGSGDSDGEFAQATYVSGWAEDLENVIAWVKQQPMLQRRPIILYGHSLGGLVVLTRNSRANDIAARIVFAPVIHPVENFRNILLGTDLWDRAVRGETIANFFGKGFALDGRFAMELVQKQYNPLEAARQFAEPILIIHGTQDAVVPIQGSEELFSQYQSAKKFCRLDMDHLATGHHAELQHAVLTWLRHGFAHKEHTL